MTFIQRTVLCFFDLQKTQVDASQSIDTVSVYELQREIEVTLSVCAAMINLLRLYCSRSLCIV